MESTNCNLCGENNYVNILNKGRYNRDAFNVICKNCGLVYLNPRMSYKEYSEYYQKVYPILFGEESSLETRSASEIRRGKEILQFIGKYIKMGAVVLDIGCGTGGMLHVFKAELNCEVHGIESNPDWVRFARDNYAVNVKLGMIDTVDLPNLYYDVIIVSHVIEHLLDPNSVLLKLKESLKNQGLLYIETPNLLTPNVNLEFYFQNSHPYTYSESTLKAIGQKTGFTCIKIDTKKRAVIKALFKKDKANNRLKYNPKEYKKILRKLFLFEARWHLKLFILNIFKCVFGIERYSRLKKRAQIFLNILMNIWRCCL